MKKTLLLCLGLMLSTMCFSQAYIEVATDEKWSYEIDLLSIKKTDNHVYLWMKSSFINETVRQTEAESMAIELKDSRWANYDHCLMYVVYDLSNTKNQPLKLIYVSKDNHNLWSLEWEESDERYNTTSVGSPEMAVYDILLEQNELEYNEQRFSVRTYDLNEFLRIHSGAEFIDDSNPSTDNHVSSDINYVTVTDFCSFKLHHYLEVRKDGSLIDRGVKKLHETYGWEYQGDKITLQPIGAEEFSSKYCRIIISKYEDGGLGCGIEDLSKEEIETMKWITIEKLKEDSKQYGIKITSHSDVSIQQIGGKYALHCSYIRESSSRIGTPVTVITYQIFEGNSKIEITVSYRESEASLWETPIAEFINSFELL
jgi:hypothetical protein